MLTNKLFENQSCTMFVHRLIKFRLSWVAIGKNLGVSRPTLYRKRKETGVVKHVTFTDNDLKEKVVEIKESLPDSGERLLQGTLRSQGISVPRWRLCHERMLYFTMASSNTA